MFVTRATILFFYVRMYKEMLKKRGNKGANIQFVKKQKGRNIWRKEKKRDSVNFKVIMNLSKWERSNR